MSSGVIARGWGMNCTSATLFPLIVVLLVAFAPEARSAESAFARCPPKQRLTGQISDFRMRNSNPDMEWSYRDNWANHTGPALENLSKGHYTRDVMADLNFTLTWWPNHVHALNALIQYDAGGGKAYEFMPTECYFVDARRLFPDDASVVLGQGKFYWQKERLQDAKESYETALELSGASAEAHYNLGLVYFELKDYAQARQHAESAYALGHPLPGLRNKLKSVGRW